MPEYTMVRVDEITRTVRSGKRFRAFETSASVLAFGALIWGGFFIYDLFSNTTRQIQAKFAEISQDPSLEVETVVNPAVLTEEGIAEAVKAFKPRGSLSRASYERALRSIAGKITAEGAGTLTNMDIMIVKRAEVSLVKIGMLDKSMVTAIHPVDKVADFVSRDKRYWGIVLGLMVIPALPVIGDIARGMTDPEGDR